MPVPSLTDKMKVNALMDVALRAGATLNTAQAIEMLRELHRLNLTIYQKKRTWNARRPVKARGMSRDKKAKAVELLRLNPDMIQREAGAVMGVDQGRVNEAVVDAKKAAALGVTAKELRHVYDDFKDVPDIEL